MAGLLAVMLAGCGNSEWNSADAQVTTLRIDKDGKVLEIVIEDFAESYYDEAEFKDLLESDIASYIADAGGSGGSGTPIVLNEIKKEGTKIRTSTTYETAEDYSDFTLENLYYGTVRQGRLRGFELPSRLNSAANKPYQVTDADADNHVIFTDGKDHIVTPYKIIAATEGVSVIADYEADFSGTEGRSAVLLEK
ncbi:MAG: hypothetical protein IK096_02520 [Lachnospiraceae bacterium]|nr:hypothetical protein [Lachnospiraceae bacterium]